MKTSLAQAILSLSIVGLAGCLAELQTPTRVTAAPTETVQQAQATPHTGPKKRVAVMRFENKAASQGSWDIGSGMAEQLTTSLVKSGRFIVIERQALQDIVSEQQFGASGMVKRETALRMGALEAPEFLVYGAVTSFKGDYKGADVGGAMGQGASIGSTLGSLVSPFGGAAIGGVVGGIIGGAVNYQQAYVSIDLRIIDANTGRVVNATSVEGTPQSAGASVSAAPGEFAFGLSGFYNEPIGRAVRACLDKAVEWITSNAFVEATASPAPAKPASAPEKSRAATVQTPSPPQILQPATPSPTAPLHAVTGNYNFRETPNGTILGQLRPGDQVVVLETSGAWSRVQTVDGRTAWIISRALKPVEMPALQPASIQPATVSQPAAPNDLLYILREGDSLPAVAASLTGSESNWPQIAEYNSITDGSQVGVGQAIRIPGRMLLEKFQGK